MMKNRKTHNPLLMIDYYKSTHSMMYPKNITKLVSYLTPRTSRIANKKLMNFGLQGFIKEFLIEIFEESFFSRPKEEVMDEYRRILDNTLGKSMYDIDKVEQLYDLGYLPIKIKEIPEGMRVPIGVPMLSIENSHPDFAWLVNTIESVMSAYFWHTSLSAEVGYIYRKICEKAVDKTCDDNVEPQRLMSDFSFRGQESPESAVRSSAAWLISHYFSATVPSVMWLEDYYNADCEHEIVGLGATSTEHSVMCSNFAVDGDEKTFIKRLITEIYPKGYLTCVCDSYDYWNVVNNVLPSLKDEIMNRDGCLGVRGDSGDPVDIVVRTVHALWDSFGGTINSKGYKVLDSHVKAVYGDSITVQRAKKIYDLLEKDGFAANNVSLGVGSFSFQSIEDDGILKPFTRDTFGIAVKSTYAVVDGKEQKIFKDPITDSGIKKSQKGLVFVYRNDSGELVYEDDMVMEEYIDFERKHQEEMIEIFCDGDLIHDFTLKEIRDNVDKEVFQNKY